MSAKLIGTLTARLLEIGVPADVAREAAQEALLVTSTWPREASPDLMSIRARHAATGAQFNLGEAGLLARVAHADRGALLELAAVALSRAEKLRAALALVRNEAAGATPTILAQTAREALEEDDALVADGSPRPALTEERAREVAALSAARGELGAGEPDRAICGDCGQTVETVNDTLPAHMGPDGDPCVWEPRRCSWFVDGIAALSLSERATAKRCAVQAYALTDPSEATEAQIAAMLPLVREAAERALLAAAGWTPITDGRPDFWAEPGTGFSWPRGSAIVIIRDRPYMNAANAAGWTFDRETGRWSRGDVPAEVQPIGVGPCEVCEDPILGTRCAIHDDTEVRPPAEAVSASQQARWIVQQLIYEMSHDNDVDFAPKVSEVQWSVLAAAVQRMLDAGVAFSDDDVQLIAAGDADEAEERFGPVPGYEDVSGILNAIFNGEEGYRSGHVELHEVEGR